MSLVPNFLASGVLTVLVSMALIAWALLFVPKRGSALAILLMSASLLVVGGGFGPPLLGIVLGIGATRLVARSTWWDRSAPPAVRRTASRCWPWALGLAVAAWILVMPGTMILDRLAGLEIAERAVIVFTPAAFLGLIGALLTASARDADTCVQSGA
jgi:hypothetical protein